MIQGNNNNPSLFRKVVFSSSWTFYIKFSLLKYCIKILFIYWVLPRVYFCSVFTKFYGSECSDVSLLKLMFPLLSIYKLMLIRVLWQVPKKQQCAWDPQACKKVRLHCVPGWCAASAELGKPKGLELFERRGASQGPGDGLALYFLATNSRP